jgi:HPt (histidine-containing phosphotransfer) domain-containing protein
MSGDPNARLEAFRRRFAQRASDDRERLAPLLAELRAGFLAEDGRRAMARIAHGLAGVGGTLGYPSVSEAASRLEDRCLGQDVEVPSDADLLAACEALVRELDLVR